MAPKVTPQFQLLKVHLFFAKAAIWMMIFKIPKNRIYLFKTEVDSIRHTLSRVTGEEESILQIVA